MLNQNRMSELQKLVLAANPNTLRTKRSRKDFAHTISLRLNLLEYNVNSFVEEMRGLNFYSDEDRLLFIQFAECAF